MNINDLNTPKNNFIDLYVGKKEKKETNFFFSEIGSGYNRPRIRNNVKIFFGTEYA